MQADRVPRAVAAQPVPLAVHPRRSRAQHRATWAAVRRLPRDDRGHVAVTVLAGALLASVGGRQDHQPGTVPRPVFDLDSHRTVRVEADQAPPALGRGGEQPQVAGQRAQRRTGRGRAVMRLLFCAWFTLVRAAGGRRGWAGTNMLASARMAISGATDMSAVNSAVNGISFAALRHQPRAGGADGDNGQLRVVVSNNTKDRARARASRRHPGGHRDGGLRGLACRIAYTVSDRVSSHRGIGYRSRR